MRKLKLFSILFFCLAVVLLCYTKATCFACDNGFQYTTDDMLSFFGFTQDEQKQAFWEICKQAGVEIPEAFGAKEAMNIVQSTQEKMVNRNDKQERWEINPLDWMKQNPDIIIEDLRKLNFIDFILPKEKEYDVACILGARMPAMQARIKYLESLTKKGYKIKRVVLLTGERHATKNVDATEQELLDIANSFNISTDELTEAHLFKYLYANSYLADNKYELIVIDVSQMDGRRPTTQTTVSDFSKWQKQCPEIKTALFISGQPHVKYQQAIISEILFNDGNDLKFEVVGNSVAQKNVQDLVGALGSYIWANMPGCLRNMGITIDSEILDMAKKLYAHQKWLYDYLPMAQ